MHPFLAYAVFCLPFLPFHCPPIFAVTGRVPAPGVSRLARVSRPCRLFLLPFHFWTPIRRSGHFTARVDSTLTRRRTPPISSFHGHPGTSCRQLIPSSPSNGPLVNALRSKTRKTVLSSPFSSKVICFILPILLVLLLNTYCNQDLPFISISFYSRQDATLHPSLYWHPFLFRDGSSILFLLSSLIAFSF